MDQLGLILIILIAFSTGIVAITGILQKKEQKRAIKNYQIHVLMQQINEIQEILENVGLLDCSSEIISVIAQMLVSRIAQLRALKPGAMPEHSKNNNEMYQALIDAVNAKEKTKPKNSAELAIINNIVLSAVTVLHKLLKGKQISNEKFEAWRCSLITCKQHAEVMCESEMAAEYKASEDKNNAIKHYKQAMVFLQQSNINPTKKHSDIRKMGQTIRELELDLKEQEEDWNTKEVAQNSENQGNPTNAGIDPIITQSKQSQDSQHHAAP